MGVDVASPNHYNNICDFKLNKQIDVDHGEMAELVEGARLESGYMVMNCVVGSNPTLSAIKRNTS